ncbi:MAG: diaminopimelate decarboxylase [Gammaproteobacteria bacterium]
MPSFAYANGQLGADGVSLAEVAGRFGTPCYVYSRAAIERQWHAYNGAFGAQSHLICYAVKASSNIAILNVLARLGSGFDIVSGGELERVIRGGGDPRKVVFSGVGKRREEIQRALEAGIKCFNVESGAELELINRIAAAADRTAPVSLRVNPDIDVNTHPYIATGLRVNKFGIPYESALALYETAAAMSYIKVIGIDCHIGSQITVLTPFIDALTRLRILIEQMARKGISLMHIDIGGGLGINYRDEKAPTAEEYIRAVRDVFSGNTYELIVEPGRSITGNAGVLLTRVEYIKKTPHRNFVIVDAAMNDILRPSLYDAWHDIVPVQEARDGSGEGIYDIVGPVCETGDFLGRERKLSLAAGDLLAVCSAGAYGFSMSSTYNARPRACEVMLDRGRIHEIRRRETIEELMSGEALLPD